MKNLVGGKWVDAVEGGTMEVLNPATGETIVAAPRGTRSRSIEEYTRIKHVAVKLA